MACFCGAGLFGFFFFSPESFSAIFITTSSVVMKRQKVADLIKKFSNNVRNTFEKQATIWSEVVP